MCTAGSWVFTFLTCPHPDDQSPLTSGSLSAPTRRRGSQRIMWRRRWASLSGGGRRVGWTEQELDLPTGYRPGSVLLTVWLKDYGLNWSEGIHPQLYVMWVCILHLNQSTVAQEVERGVLSPVAVWSQSLFHMRKCPRVQKLNPKLSLTSVPRVCGWNFTVRLGRPNY